MELPTLPPPATTVRTHCPYCAFQCGMRLTSGGEDASVAIEPDVDFPVNAGQMCVKGFTSGELLSSPDRMTTPLLRDAAGAWREASWEEALDFVAGEFLRIRDSYGPAAVACYGSGALTNEKAYALGKFARVALKTPNVDYNGRYCMSSAAAAQNAAFGIDRGLNFPVEDIAGAQTVLLWGSNCADTLPPIMQWFDRQRAAGGTLFVVDPRRSATARAADFHLQLTPGSDLALANGLLFIAIEEDLIDRDYLAQRTIGFEQVRQLAMQYYPPHVERLTGVSESELRRVVRSLASGPSMLLSGRGPEQQSKGTDTVLAMINLMLALGKIGKPNSGYGCLTGQGNGQGGREHGQKADQLPGYRLIENDADRAHVARVWRVSPDDLPRRGLSATEAIAAIRPDGIRGWLSLANDLAVSAPNANWARERLADLECLVVCDAFLNETSRHAHAFLPTLQWAEEEGTLTNLEGRVIRRRSAILPPDGPRSDLWIFRELADRLGQGDKFAFDSPREVFEELREATRGARADYSGITYERIDDEEGVFWPCPGESHPGTPRMFADRFAYPDGKARCVPVAHRPAGEEPDEAYPYWFTTGRYREHYNSGGQTRRTSKLIEAKPFPRLQVHPRTAQRHGIDADDLVRVESRRGAVRFRVEITSDIRPDVVFAPFHWGGRDAANVLTSTKLDPKSRMPEFKISAVRLSPAYAEPEIESDRDDSRKETR
jgi:assimilatory nitrate reductase catalytic subunit